MRTLAENFAPYPEAKDMKELGFNDEQTTCFGNFINEKLCLGFFHPTHCTEDTILAPTYSQAFEFFREKYGYDVTIKKCTPSEYKFEIEQLFAEGNNHYFIDFPFKSHKEAELECVRAIIQFIKEHEEFNI